MFYVSSESFVGICIFQGGRVQFMLVPTGTVIDNLAFLGLLVELEQNVSD